MGELRREYRIGYMKIKNVSFNEDELPEKLTVEMSVDEATLIYGLTGTIAPRLITNKVGLKFGNALGEVASCLSGTFFNRFWDNGAHELIDTEKMRELYRTTSDHDRKGE